MQVRWKYQRHRINTQPMVIISGQLLAFGLRRSVGVLFHRLVLRMAYSIAIVEILKVGHGAARARASSEAGGQSRGDAGRQAEGSRDILIDLHGISNVWISERLDFRILASPVTA